ncbi:helix-turn-helix domain-containing protein [Frankia sp. CNm7]|uniref:Helix-turn-helix domain-containing protein n=2 Tax=Frankia nepalensis TaxID=1836974 RepID=A0A937RCT0_9ACTN|nr:helix-turn-helix domain-containing protein [Frankia nepalensis]MBL7496612.1 helix-turn-helix domain-containing protein [Frankia nepalensis]MBL7513355.1 helix-turn-helix domain-containing protein [Frankia nepalensis]MBL7521614.1 helix-turn-helix domain-containing protein [Frankia nepalensis]MBL7626620.1 helix-turn-helix domain-containing protein [Frankia nepalensis]
MAFRRVAAYAPPGVTALGLGIVHATFGSRPGIAGFDVAVCARRPGPLPTDLGLPVTVRHDLRPLATADLIIVLPAVDYLTEPSDPVLQALRAAHGRGAIIAAHCVGAFTLAMAGLLDGRTVTTHWQFAAELAARHPEVTVAPEALYIDEGRIVTGAGAAAGLDMCLHLIRREHGAGLANEIARGLVVPPHRDGGQAQYVSTPVPADSEDQRLATVIAWARAHLDHRISVDMLAAKALMSRRSFLRHFRSATGTSPHAWLRTQRLSLAEQLLETTDLSIEQIATRVGYRGAAALREQFVLQRGVSPSAYRRTFSGS